MKNGGDILMKIENPKQYIGRYALNVARELGVDIDTLLDELVALDIYHCPKCGFIVEIEEVGELLETPCKKCIARKDLIGKDYTVFLTEKGLNCEDSLTYIDSFACSVCTKCDTIVDMNDITADDFFGCTNCR
jgi:hypothetical protein